MNQSPLEPEIGIAKVLSIRSGVTRAQPCPVCGGHPRGRPKCSGRVEGVTAWCTSVHLAHGIACEEGFYPHTLRGVCACDRRHDGSASPSLDLGLRTASTMSRARRAPELIVPEMGLHLGPGMPHMFAGEPSAGKTIVLQALFLAMLRGVSTWAGFTIGKLRHGRIVHIDFEMGEHLLDLRYQRLAIGMGFRLDELRSSLSTASYPAYRLVPEHKDTWRQLMRDADIILIDSLGSAAGFSLNARELTTEAMQMIGDLSGETGCRPFLIHHPRKTTPLSIRNPDPDTAIRGFLNELCGSGGIGANIDAGLGCIGREGEPIFVGQFRARTVGAIIPSFTLNVIDVDEGGARLARDPRNPSPGLRLEKGPSDAFLAQRRAWDAIAAARSRDEERAKEESEVLDALPEHEREGHTVDEVAALVDIPEKRTRRALLILIGKGTVERYSEKTGRRGRAKKLYRKSARPPSKSI